MIGDPTAPALRFEPREACSFELGPTEIHVWRASLRLTPEALYHLRGFLSEDERERASRLHFLRDRDAFLAARGTLRSLLSAYLNLPPAEIQFRYSAYGKPSLPDHPIQFNLSHSGDLAVFAFSRYGNVGVDVESQERPAPLEVAERFFSSVEARHLHALADAEQPLAFFQCWTRKEAVIKALGIGLSAPLDQFDVAFGPHEQAALLHGPKEFGPASEWHIENIVPEAGYVAAMAVQQVCPSIRGFTYTTNT